MHLRTWSDAFFPCGWPLIPGLWLAVAVQAELSGAGIIHDPANATVTIADGSRSLVLRLRYDGRCLLDQVLVNGRNVVDAQAGVASAVKANAQWHTTRLAIPPVRVTTTNNSVTVTGITFGQVNPVREQWQFTALSNRIIWRIEREYLRAGVVEDIGLPIWDFADMSTWTGALLGHGGVAWGKLFDRTNATYGVHSGEVTLWNRHDQRGLRIRPVLTAGGQVATRFTRQTNQVFTLAYQVTETRLAPQHNLRRFLPDRQDVWAPWTVQPGVVVVEFILEALRYDQAFDRGHFPGLNGGSILEILNTIGRIGAIDDEIMGSNGYYSGFAVLHEPWIAQFGLAINDPAYLQSYARTLDHQRDHALGPDGRIKSRWAYDAGDAMPGTYDPQGYYECQWGWLMDSQPSYVINVAEQFDLTGDLAWLRRHQASAEKALDFLCRRDRDNDGLVEMMTESHQAGKGSDWIDVIWAAHENAFVNAQLYQALTLWAEAEHLLGNPQGAETYRQRAQRLKSRFNQSTADGGLWSATKSCYVHWRDRDDSVHGDNLVVPVNFMAIAYGICEPPERARGILDQIERRMQQEALFFWPLCFDSYRPGEGAAWQFPFPVYENGDLFLAWGEVGTRAYAPYRPEVALKYIKKVLDQYERDGLACQRYLRKSQRGEGTDILANNGSPIVGLYRNIYGVQPKWNRLLIDPHLPRDLDGTQLKYGCRGQTYRIGLQVDHCRLAADDFSLHGRPPLAVDIRAQRADYFFGSNSHPSLTIVRANPTPVEIKVLSWSDRPEARKSWIVSVGSVGVTLEQTLSQLSPDTEYALHLPEGQSIRQHTDGQGKLTFTHRFADTQPVVFECKGLVSPE